MANNTTTFTAKIEADTKQAEQSVDNFTGAVENSIAGLRKLKQQLKETEAGSATFKKISADIRDVEDAIEGAKLQADDFAGALESAPGVVGQLAGAFKKVEIATKSWGAALRATGVGLIVSAVGLLVAAFSQTEGSLKKLEPLLIGMEKIFGGLVEAVQPLLDIILDLGLKALPYVVTGVKTFYGSLAALFTLVKEGGAGVGTILKGLFTLDSDLISKGYDQIKGSVGEAGKTFDEFTANFEKGYKKRTKTQKEGDADAEAARLKREAAQKEFEKAQMQAAIELLEGQEKEQAALAVKYHEERLKYEGRTAAELLIFDEAYQKQRTDIDKKYADEAQKKREEAYSKEQSDTFAQYQEMLAISKEYKAQQDAITFQGIQNRITELDSLNEALDNDFEQDRLRLEQKRIEEANATAIRLQAVKVGSDEYLKIIQEAADKERAINKAVTASTIAEVNAKKEIQLQYADYVQQIGGLVGQVAGENKDLAIAGIVIEQGAALAKVIISTNAANAAATLGAAPFLTNPVTAVPASLNLARVITGNYIQMGLSSAGIIAGAVKGITAINSAKVPGGGGGGAGAASAPSIEAPRIGNAAAPQMAEGVGANPSTQIAQTIGNASKEPVRAYVVSQDITSQQMLDRKSNQAAVF